MRSEEDRQAICESLCAAVGQQAAEAVMEVLDRVDRIMLAQEGSAAALRGELAEAVDGADARRHSSSRVGVTWPRATSEAARKR